MLPPWASMILCTVARPSRSLPLGGEIGIENMRQGVRRDAHPGIPDFEAQGIGFGMQRQEQLAAVRHGFKPVQAQVQDHLTHPVGIDGHIRQHLGRVKPYGDLVIGGVLPDEAGACLRSDAASRSCAAGCPWGAKALSNRRWPD